MKAKWIGGVAMAVALLAVACGPGRAIFVIDVYSFLKDSGKDTLHYTILGGINGTADNPAQQMTLLGGLGKSDVDSVTIIAGGNLINNSGQGSVTFQLFFGADSASTYTGSPALSIGPAAVNGAQTVPIGGQAVLVGDSLFKRQKIWVGVRAGVNANPGPAVDGKAQVTGLTMRIVFKDKIF
jgi:hypothetical protein